MTVDQAVPIAVLLVVVWAVVFIAALLITAFGIRRGPR